MSDFSSDVFRAFASLGFTPSKSTAGRDFAALLRRESHDVCSYIYARDDRRGKGATAVEYWVAPPDFPDDGLDNLGVGYKVAIASTYDFDDSFWAVARTRLGLLLQVTSRLAELVHYEFEKPACVTRRLRAYHEQVALYEAILEFLPPGETQPILERAADVVSNGRPYAHFVSECERLLDLLRANQQRFTSQPLRLLDRPQLVLQTMISRHLYVELLVPFSKGQ